VVPTRSEGEWFYEDCLADVSGLPLDAPRRLLREILHSRGASSTLIRAAVGLDAQSNPPATRMLSLRDARGVLRDHAGRTFHPFAIIPFRRVLFFVVVQLP